MSKNIVKFEWWMILDRLKEIDKENAIIYGVPTGGMILTAFLKKAKVVHNPKQATLILDDIVDSGETRQFYNKFLPNTEFYSLVKLREFPDQWVEFPWETDHPGGAQNVQQNIVRQLQYMGEDPNREGLKETPKRVVKSWKEIYGGYNQDIKSVFKLFDCDHDQIILLKDIEMYSMCEHHMLPFFGKAHIAYIPNGKKVIGISKLARLLEIISRKLQIQERIGTEVVQALNKYLEPKGAACIIEAQHMCMTMRGVNKQNSVMTTSSLTGAFFNSTGARMELMGLIR